MKGGVAGPLRILISGRDICGLIHDLGEELSRRGHHVATAAVPTNRFYAYRYDYHQHRFPACVLGKRYHGTRLWDFAFRQLGKVRPGLLKSLEKRFRVSTARSADLYIRVWGQLDFDQEVLGAIDRYPVKVATFLMGSDVRDYDVYARQFGVSRWEFPAECYTPSRSEKLRTLRMHERYADAIFSVPDQMGLALRPYHHLQVPLRLDRFHYNVPGRVVPRVVHAPSAPHLKGTDLIEEALQTLRAEGVDFEFVSFREMPHPNVLAVLSDADVLVDEVVLHGPGWLSFEAMASGCAVATRYLPGSPECFRPPVWPIDEHNITDCLRTLLTDRDLRIRLATEGRHYVERNNSIEDITNRVLEKTLAGRSAATDYVPDYLVTAYVPKDGDEARCINEANALVAGEAWYKERVAGSAHDGLIF